MRFVNIYHEGWDAHTDVAGNSQQLQGDRQGSAALVHDLKQRGLLESTLVIWGGEFGRTPMVENNPRSAAASAATIIRKPLPSGWPAAASSPA